MGQKVRSSLHRVAYIQDFTTVKKETRLSSGKGVYVVAVEFDSILLIMS